AWRHHIQWLPSFLLGLFFFFFNEVKTAESLMLYLSEDFHILLHAPGLEVTFRPTPRSPEVVLMRGGLVVGSRAKKNIYLSHLVVDSLVEGDEGVYTVKNPEDPEDVRRIRLFVRDCYNEQTVKYGENFRIPLLEVTPPITLEHRPSAVEANLTSRPALVLLTSTGKPREGYQGRISVSDHHVVLRSTTGADDGSYTVRDALGAVRIKICLQVIEHPHFVNLHHGERLKINLMLNSSMVHLYYSADTDHQMRLLMDRGEFTDLGFEGRLSVEGSLVFLDQVKRSDEGLFKVTDTQGFPVSSIHMELKPYKLESIYVAVIALLSLLVFLLLACLLSCLIKVQKRAKRAAALEKIAQNAGKEDEGEAFRQVVKNITKLSEESKHSQADNTEKSQSTEVDIKGLEVSSKEVGIGNLDTSDSGVGFNTALPLDTDTDAPEQIPDSDAVSISIAPETKSSAPPPPTMEEVESSPVAESKPSAAPAVEVKPETKDVETPPAQSVNLDVPKPADVKSSPVSSPVLKSPASPATDPKPVGDTLEPKSTTPKAPSPAPEPHKMFSSATQGAYEPPSSDDHIPFLTEPIPNGMRGQN
uniref:Si:dkeyp-77h1.4 n=1 Tax=Hippocampus comes TaxID=109280 RepID=A0A3Q3DY65_HIPCM